MNDGQQKFLQYILACVQEDNEDAAKKLLDESFDKQRDGSFSHNDLSNFHSEIIKRLKPERKEEVMNVLHQFGEMHINK